jgi:DNA (cytosine-5)-methyltransferase 1
MIGLTAIDLFAGSGGTTSGLVLAGCDVRLAIESDKDAVATYSANFPQVTIVPERIESYTAHRILHEARLKREELGILAACPPCQGFSTLGKHDRDDKRNGYIDTVGALLEPLSPKALLLENVPGLSRDSRFSGLKRVLAGLGYGVGHWVLDGTEVCVPQRRKRLVVVAIRGLRDEEIDDPRSSYQCAEWPAHPHTVRQVLKALGSPDGVDCLHTARRLSGKVLKRAHAIPHDGGSRRDLPKNLRLECHKVMKDRGAANVYGRMWWDEPAPTITTRCTTPACGRFLHPEEDRPITLREAAAFQTFPPDYHWFGGVQSIGRQIGNAVPVRLAHVLAIHVIKLVGLAEGRGGSI